MEHIYIYMYKMEHIYIKWNIYIYMYKYVV